MKTLTIIAIVALTFSTLAFSKSNDKFYQVNDNGKFQYSFWTEDGNDHAKTGARPVTLRTFFLETERNGLLPSEMTYGEFSKLSIEEKQAILAGSQYYIIAAMKNAEKIVTETATATESIMIPVEAVKVTEDIMEEETTTNRAALDINAPWIVKAVTNPGTETDPSAGKIEIIIENNELPWVVDLIVNEGRQTKAKYASDALKTSKKLNASK